MLNFEPSKDSAAQKPSPSRVFEICTLKIQVLPGSLASSLWLFPGYLQPVTQPGAGGNGSLAYRGAS